MIKYLVATIYLLLFAFAHILTLACIFVEVPISLLGLLILICVLILLFSPLIILWMVNANLSKSKNINAIFLNVSKIEDFNIGNIFISTKIKYPIVFRIFNKKKSIMIIPKSKVQDFTHEDAKIMLERVNSFRAFWESITFVGVFCLMVIPILVAYLFRRFRFTRQLWLIYSLPVRYMLGALKNNRRYDISHEEIFYLLFEEYDVNFTYDSYHMLISIVEV